MEEHSIFRIYKKENYKFHIVNRKYSASQTISKSYIERSNNMHTHKKTFRIGASTWQRWQDTKGIIRSRKLKKDRKYNDQQNTTYKTIDGATRSPIKTVVNTDTHKTIDGATRSPLKMGVNTDTHKTIDGATRSPLKTGVNTDTHKTIDGATRSH